MRAAVIGGGIGGATAALALAAIGIKVDIHEARERSVEDKGWVTLGPAAMTGLDQVGVADELLKVGFPVTTVRSTDVATRQVTEFARREPTHWYPSTHVWRRDLLFILRAQLDKAGIDCHYGSTATTAGVMADLIIGADGARSAVRRSIGNLLEPTYTGEIIRYGHHSRPVAELPCNVLHFWRHGTGVIGYVGDVRDGSFWFSRQYSDSPNTGIELDDMTAPLRGTPVATVLEESWVGPPIALYELDPGGIWHHDHTVVIGDAAHAVSPASGRGATSTIEDAIMLAKHLHSHAYAVPEALDSFTAHRRPIAQATYRPTAGQRSVAATADELDLNAHRPVMR